MNKTAIGLLFIVIVTISVLSYFLLSKCPNGKERKGFKCVDKVSTSTTSRSGLVGSSGAVNCLVGQVANANGICVIPRQIIPPITPAQISAGQRAGVTSYTQCPLSHPLKEYRSCVNACAPGLFIDISECIQSCPSNKVLHNGRCLTSCPTTHPFRDLSNGVIPICVTACPTARPANGSNCQSCSTRVPSQVNNRGQCLASCPTGTYRNDISMCVPINPLSNSWTFYANGLGNAPRSNSVDGNWDTYAESSISSDLSGWIYFPIENNKKIYGFSLKFGKINNADNVTISLYKDTTTVSPTQDSPGIINLNNQDIFYTNNFSSDSPTIDTIRQSFPNGINTSGKLVLYFSRKIRIYEFEITVR